MAISQEDLNAVKSHAKDMESADQTRLEVFDGMDDMYMMTSSKLPSEDWIKKTISPAARNKEDGMFRLLAGTDPVWSVPRETNAPSVRKLSSMLERAAKTIWDQAGQIALKPRHYDAIRSGIHYGEIHILVHSTKSMLDLSKPGTGSYKRAQDINQRTPVLFDIVNPRDGHPQWGTSGLLAYYSRRRIKVAEIRERFPDALPGRKTTDLVDLHDYWSLDWHVVWTDADPEPYVAEPNEEALIPVVAVLCEGGYLFNINGQDNSRQPFLYTAWKSSIWERLNLFLTVSSSLIFYLGSKPIMVYEGPSEDAPVVDRSEPGGMIMLKPGERLTPLMEKVLDPALLQMSGVFEANFEDSTLFKTALGGIVSAGDSFSKVSLQAQQGRLPTIVYQRMISMAIGEAMRIGFKIAKRDKVKINAQGKNGLQQLEPAKIPDQFDLVAKLEVNLPQDDRLNAQVAAQGIQGGLWSKAYAREAFLQIGQSDDMEDAIWEERYADLQAQIEMQRMQAQAQAQLQQEIAAGQQGGIPGGPGGPQQGGQAGPPQPQGPGGIPPELMAQLQQQGRPGPGGPGGPPPDIQSAQQGLPMGAPQDAGGDPFGPGGQPPDQFGGGLQ